MASKSIIAKPGEGEALWFMGSLFEIKISSEDSDGSLVVVEMTLSPNSIGAPPHTHIGSESTLLLEGNVRYHIGNKVVDCGAGTQIFFPKGTWEWYENVTSKPARILLTYAPGQQMDVFFREVAEKATSRQLPPPMQAPPDFQRLSTIAKKYGLELKPPPDQAQQPRPH